MTDFDKRVNDLKAKERFDFYDLCQIMELLRDERGCPWDREQNHKTIRKNIIEEAYEAAEAIDTDNSELLCEELGDYMLQAVFHAQISKENGGFDMNDVCTGICSKLILRHPHIFGDVSVSDSGDVLKNWEAIKQQSKGVKTVSGSIDGVSKALPALVRAHKIGAKAAKVNFDFASPEAALEKVREETAEVSEALALGDYKKIEEEIGDLLLAVSCVARLAKVDAEEALCRANDKFTERFRLVEAAALAENADISAMSEEEKDLLWEKSKKNA